MKIIVTGGAGFLGTHICRELNAHGHETVVIDRAVDGARSDLRFPGNVERHFDRHADADCCIHLAAEVGRLLAERNAMTTISANVGMTALVARACAERGIRLVYASSSEAYGDNGDAVCDEYDGPFALPHNLYGITKRMGEDICRHYTDDLAILRFSMPYGPGMPTGYGRAAIVNFLYNALHRQPITVHRGAERSWCYVEDTARAVRIALDTDVDVLNVGRDDAAVPMIAVAYLACELVGSLTPRITEIDAPEMQSVVKRLSMKRLYNLGWAPLVDLPSGMARTLEWLKIAEARAA